MQVGFISYYNNILMMKRQIRSQSAKTMRITRRKSVPVNQKPLDAHVDLCQFNQEHKITVSQKPMPASKSTTLDSSSLEKGTLRSKNKFLQRLKNIPQIKEQLVLQWKTNFRHRSIKRLSNKQKKQQSKEKVYVFQNKEYSISSKNTTEVSIKIQLQAQPSMVGHVDTNMLNVPPSSRKRKRSVSPAVQFVSLQKKPLSEFIIKQNPNEGAYLHGYWRNERKFVSLIPLQKNQKVSFKHKNLIEIYAQVIINQKRYVISDQYQNCSLQNLLDQYGYFNQVLAKRYLKQVALGLQHMHFHRKVHNRISTKTTLYNKNGELLINTVKSTSFVLSKDELASHRQLHNYAPQFLFSIGFSKSFKNDVWALGCLAIAMLTPDPLSQSSLHPYNFEKYNDPQQKEMIDQLKSLHKHHFLSEPKRPINRPFPLSAPAINFISVCLSIMSSNRPSIQTLLQHQFLQGV